MIKLPSIIKPPSIDDFKVIFVESEGRSGIYFFDNHSITVNLLLGEVPIRTTIEEEDGEIMIVQTIHPEVIKAWEQRIRETGAAIKFGGDD